MRRGCSIIHNCTEWGFRPAECARTKAPRSPDALDAVLFEHGIGGYDGDIAYKRLRNQDALERIVVMRRREYFQLMAEALELTKISISQSDAEAVGLARKPRIVCSKPDEDLSIDEH